MIWFILAIVLNSKNNFIIAKLTIGVWCGVADEKRFQTLVNKSLTW